MSGDPADVSLCGPDNEAVAPVEGFPGITPAASSIRGVVSAPELDDVAGLDLDGLALSGVNGGDLLPFARLVVMAIDVSDRIVPRACGENQPSDRLGAVDDLDRTREGDIEWVDQDAIV